MKKRNITLISAGLVIAAGCAMQVNQRAADPRTKYIVKFETPTLLVDKPKFIDALNKASWRRDIAFTPKENGDPNPDHDRAPIMSSVTHTLLISQDSTVNPDGTNVTQRVGFNRGQERDLEALLKQVKE